MAKHVRYWSNAAMPEALLRTTDSLPAFSSHTERVATLATPETLRMTLGLTRSESYWRLTHSPFSGLQSAGPVTPQADDSPRGSPLAAEALATALDLSQGTRPNSRSRGCRTRRGSSVSKTRRLPTDRDYRRTLARLEKVISGSAFSFRSMQLVESKPIDVTLDTNEWQFFRVKTQGMPTPLKVVLKKLKGKVVVYLSKTVQEPKDLACDEVFTRDVILFTDSDCRFKQPWVYLGLRCVEEASLKVSVHFGARHKRQSSTSALPNLADLSEFRKNEVKHQALAERVKEILVQRAANRALKYSSKNYVAENVLTLGRMGENRGDEPRKREEVLRRYMENLKEKKIRAQTILRRREIRLEAETKAREKEMQQQRQKKTQRQWLSLASFITGSKALAERFLSRRETLEQAGKRVKAAMVLQRCYRKIALTINPRRLVKQHAVHHLKLLVGLVGPMQASQHRAKLFSVLRDSEQASRVRKALECYHGRMRLIQDMWRRYLETKKRRVEELEALWIEGVKSIVRSVVPPGRKTCKQAKELEAKLGKIARDKVLISYLQTCMNQYYQRISAYIHASKAFRRGIKAFIFAKLKQGEAVFLSGAPDFLYLLPLEDMKEMIQAAAENV